MTTPRGAGLWIRDEGGGDGDCAPVERELITAFDFNSMCGLNSLSVRTWPTLAGSPQDLIFDMVNGKSGHSTEVGAGPTYTEIEVADTGDFDETFEMTLSLTAHKPTANATTCRVTFVANYPGVGDIPLRLWTVAFGGAMADEWWSGSLSIRVPPYSLIPGATGDPTVRCVLDRVSGNDNTINIVNADLYVKQCFPKLTQETISNCETGGPECPSIVEVVVYDNQGAPVEIGRFNGGDGPLTLPPFEVGVPLLVTIELSEDINLADWNFALLGSTIDSLAYLSGVFSVEYEHPVPGGIPTSVSCLITQTANGDCVLGEDLTIAFPA